MKQKQVLVVETMNSVHHRYESDAFEWSFASRSLEVWSNDRNVVHSYPYSAIERTTLIRE